MEEIRCNECVDSRIQCLGCHCKQMDMKYPELAKAGYAWND